MPLPIIMISAAASNGNDGIILRGLKSGANDFVHKPFNREELVVCAPSGPTPSRCSLHCPQPLQE